MIALAARRIHSTIHYHVEDGGLAAEAILYSNIPVKFGAPRDAGWLYLHRIWVRKRNRNQGLATKLMRQLCRRADQTCAPIILQVRPFDCKGLTPKALRKFYSGFGFRSATLAFGRGAMVRQDWRSAIKKVTS